MDETVVERDNDGDEDPTPNQTVDYNHIHVHGQLSRSIIVLVEEPWALSVLVILVFTCLQRLCTQG